MSGEHRHPSPRRLKRLQARLVKKISETLINQIVKSQKQRILKAGREKKLIIYNESTISLSVYQ